jgi:hypothetical protein
MSVPVALLFSCKKFLSFLHFTPSLVGPRVLLLTFLTLASAHAHKPSDSYLSLDVERGQIAVQWDIALRDLDYAIDLDGDADGSLTWGEVKAKHRDIAAYALPRLQISADGRICERGEVKHLTDDHSDGAYAVLQFSAECVAETDLQMQYSLLFDLDPQHRGLLRLSHGAQTTTAVFSPEKSAQRFVLGEESKWRQFTDYCREGIWHIWIGFDHVLFLISLLLPSVLMLQAGRWSASPEFGKAFWEVFKIVTAFTLAHSITLSLAGLEIVSLPSRWVESAIAASVLAAALNNVFPVVRAKRWLVAFAFGLIHGFGFASVLGDLGLPRESLLLALVSFNLGVEIGQLAIVAVFLPMAFALRRTAAYQSGALVGGSLAIAALALVWLAERAFDVELLNL